MKIVWANLCLIFLASNLVAQDNPALPEYTCGFTPDKTILAESITPYYRKFIDNFIHRPVSQYKSKAEFDVVQIHLRIVRMSNGMGGMNSNEVIDSILAANPFFAGAELEFEICEVSFINSDQYYVLDDDTEEFGLVSNHYSPGKINAYVMSNIVGASGLAPFAGRRDYFIVDHPGVNRYTIAHELGHVFWLWHAHGLYNNSPDECNDGLKEGVVPGLADDLVCLGAVKYDSQPGLDENGDGIPDCNQTGDKVCDTPADPNLSGKLDGNCQYTLNETDLFGDFYNPDPTNLMAYASFCRNTFTPEQHARMRFYFENMGLQLRCLDCASAPGMGMENFIVTNLNNHGPGSFRQALACANLKSNGSVTISFANGLVDSVIMLEVRLPNILCDNLTIDGSNVPGGRIVLDGTHLTGDFDDGIYFELLWSLPQNFTLKNATLRNMPSYGLLSFGNTNGITLENCRFENCGTIFGRDGIQISNSQDLVLKNIQVEQSARDGISGHGLSNVLMTCVSVEESGIDGLFFTGCQNVTIDSFWVSTVGGHGISSEQGTNMSFSNGHIELTGQTSEFGDGIILASETSPTINDVSIHHIGRVGILGIDVEDADIAAITIDDPAFDGIQFNSGSSQIQLSQLQIENCGRYGISTLGSQMLWVDNFSIANTGSRGIDSFNGQDVSFANGQVQMTGLTSQFGDGMVSDSDDQLAVDQVDFNQIGRIGILGISISNAAFNGLEFQDCGRDGLQFNSNSENIEITNTSIDGVQRYGVASFDSDNISLGNVSFANIGLDQVEKYEIYSADDVSIILDRDLELQRIVVLKTGQALVVPEGKEKVKVEKRFGAGRKAN